MKNNDKGKIFKTTDGFLSGQLYINKKRLIVAIEQRKDDGAIVVTKIHSKKGKEDKINKNFIPNVSLNPQEHISLTVESIVSKKAIFGRKDGGQKKPLYPIDFEETGDVLNKREQKRIKAGIQNDTKQHRKTYKKTLKQWKKHFK